MTVTSLKADATVAKAEECYALGLIKKSTLDRVVQNAYSNPEYNAIFDLPLDFEVENERERRRIAEHHARKVRRLLWLRKLVHR